MHPEFLALTTTFLHPGSTWHEKRETLIQLHDLFVTLGAVDAGERFEEKPHTWLPSGFAINPVSAAICMLEPARTLRFTEALRDAVADQLQKQPGRPVHVLDAGCGPYALLCILVTPFFSPQQLQFTALDFYAENLQSVKRLIALLGVSAYFRNLVETDAATYVHEGEPLHIVISETMKNGLFKEPQTAITLNLGKQLAPGGVFIPQQIALDVRMIARRERKARLLKATGIVNHTEYETALGDILQLHQHTTAADLAQNPLACITVPAHFDPNHHQLELYTTIRVYGRHRLERRDASITLPIVLLKDYEKKTNECLQLSFRYELAGNPGPRYEVVQLQAT